jgi:hypothetical protein
MKAASTCFPYGISKQQEADDEHGYRQGEVEQRPGEAQDSGCRGALDPRPSSPWRLTSHRHALTGHSKSPARIG